MANPSNKNNPENISLAVEEYKLHVSWNNRTVRKDTFTFWFLLLFWMIWAPLTFLVSALIFFFELNIFLIIWSVFGWIGTIGILLALIQRRCDEWVALTSEKIFWGVDGPFIRRKKSLPLSRIDEISLGWYSDRDEHESMVTLNIYELPRSYGFFRNRRRHLLGYWLSKENKEFIFNEIINFVSKRSISLKTTNYGIRPNSE